MPETVKEEAPLKEKFAKIQPWMVELVGSIKKDLRQEHLSQDHQFFNKYFRGKTPNKLTAEEMSEAYSRAIQEEEKGEEIAEFVFHRWLLKNTDIYHFFDKELSKITEDYTTLTTLDKAEGSRIKKEAIEKFGAEKAYLFAYLNGVVFDAETMEKLRSAAADAKKHAEQKKAVQEEQADIDAKIRNYETQITRLTDKYESRLAGLERKYEKDVSALKKQVAQLQRQLQAKS
jgi:hypothetical protein